jgi:release factor glutamine methyltransferase
MKANSWLEHAQKRLAEAGISSARLDVELLLAHAVNKDRTWLAAHHDDELSLIELDMADDFLARREAREPIAYITGYKEFYGRNFTVTPDVLIPRPETESLIELAKNNRLSGTILDVGTGSGCLGLTLALELGSDAVLSDISDPALNVARRNAETLGVKSALFTRSNLLDSIARQFDVIVANLPYVDTEWDRSPETNHEPKLALFAADGGLALIKTLISQAPHTLTPNGYLLLEADPEQHASITEYAADRFAHLATLGYGLLLQLR